MELVGTVIKKIFEGFGVFTGTIQFYDPVAGYFKVVYEDGDSEDLEFEEIRSILLEMGGPSPKLEPQAPSSSIGRPRKKKMLSDPNSTVNYDLGCELENDLEGVELDNETVAIENGDCAGGEKEPVLIPELPPSSKNLDLDGLNVFDLFSVFTCLRSFSKLLFLSPFTMEMLVAALRCEYANLLIDSIHLSILQTLKPHLELLAEEGSHSASDCVRYLNWELLDLVTWPIFLVRYLLIHGSRMKPGFRITKLGLLDSEYYTQPAEVKLEILRCLCDDVIEVDAIRSEINGRMDSAVNVDAHEATGDGNSDECCLCGMEGSLICCDGCPAAFHSRCVGVVKGVLPEGDWYCPECLVEKTDGLVKLTNPSCGAELLGIDPHGRLYFGSCDHLLVADSCEPDALYHYYHKNDLGPIITVLKSNYTYSAIANAIVILWGVSVDASDAIDQYANGIHNINEDLTAQAHLEPPLPSEHNVLSGESGEGLATENSASAEQCQPKSPFEQVITLNHTDLTAGSEKCIGFSGGAIITDRENDRASKRQSDLYNYVNYYSFGQIASSISQELIHKSLADNNIELKKSSEDIKSAQLKVISKKSVGRFCCAYRKLFMDVQKENCGWCFSCKNTSNLDCLFKVASDKKLNKFEDKILDGSESQTVELRSDENMKSHITSAIHHILSIEGRVRGLLCGPWEKAHYSPHWWKSVLKAADVASLKPLLLALELNLRRLALSVEWSKPVDDAHAVVSASIVTNPVRASSNYGGRRKKRKKNISRDECSSDHTTLSDICWWRGGRLSRQVSQCNMLPRALASKVGRQAGYRKIPHVVYPDSSDFAKRGKYISWRVAVEVSKSVAQLIYQVKDFDLNIKWAELSGTRPFTKLAKESKEMSRLMKKATICGKRNEGTQLKYLLDFGNRETVSTIVAKHGEMFEETNAERKRYWFNESHVPLNLLKSYEEKLIKKKVARLLKKADSGIHNLKESKCKMNKRKGSEWYSYLLSREQESEKQLCGHCSEDVLVREAVNCQSCGGFFHKKHFRVPKGAIITNHTCSRCKDMQNAKAKEEMRSLKAKVKDIKKLNGYNRGKQGGSHKEEPEKSENDASPQKRKRSFKYLSYWLNGLLWTNKPVNEQKRNFRENKVILPFQHAGDPNMKPLCCLCHKEYNSEVIYIGCEICQDWFHGDAFSVTTENINKLIGFRCPKCCMRSEPVCPFLQKALPGNPHLNAKCKLRINIRNEDKLSGHSIVCNEGHSDEKRREDASAAHQKDEGKLHDSLHKHRSAIFQNEGYLDGLRSANVLVQYEEELSLSPKISLTNIYITAPNLDDVDGGRS